MAELANVHTVHLGLEHVILDKGRVDAQRTVSLVVRVARESQELDWLGQGQLLHRLGTQNDGALDLGDQQILRRVGEVIALSLVQVREVAPSDVLQVVVIGDLWAVVGTGGGEVGHSRQVGRPCDAQLHVVELQGNQGQGHGPVLVEEKLEWVKAGDGVVGAQVVTRIAHQVTLTEVLGTGHWLDLSRVGDVLGVDDLTADHKLDLVDDV